MEQDQPHQPDGPSHIQSDDESHQPDGPSHVPHGSVQSDDETHQPDGPSHVPHGSVQSDDETHQPDGPSHVPHGSVQSDDETHQPDVAHVPQLDGQFQSPPLKRRKYKLDPPRQKNQFAYELMLSLREEQYARKRSASNSQSTKIIDIDACKTSTPPPRRLWIQNELITLYESEKDVIESGDWLTDSIIDAAQKILAVQFKARFGEAGFQSVGLGSTFAFAVESDEFVQVLHNGRNHWLTASSVGTAPGQMLVYDSMYPSAGQATQQQIACLMMVTEPNLTLTFADVQMQAGGSDCGVFALAFATAICFGHSPGQFHFYQQRMRTRLIECLEKKRFSMFPIRKERRQGSKIKASQTVPVHCICRMPWIKQASMIQCSHCKLWYHGRHCVKTSDNAWLPGERWLCPSCFKL